MVINFVGLFNAQGYVGEISDETHLARELERLGHQVNRVPRDVWKAWCEGEAPNDDWVLPIKADINIIAKWHAFDSADYCGKLREESLAPVWYWVWDFMWDKGFPGWHLDMAKSADLYLSGEAGIFYEYIKLDINPYYFQMDCCDGDIPVHTPGNYYDVVFTGSCIPQGDRIKWLKEITKETPVHIFAWNPDDWKALGFENVHEAVYGEDYNRIIADAKIVLGFSVEPNCYGYWSNRVGKVIAAGGFLLQQYAPGMERLIPECVDYFSTPTEAVEKIKFNLLHQDQIAKFKEIAYSQRWFWTSSYKMFQLTILMQRYLEGDPSKWNLLPTT